MPHSKNKICGELVRTFPQYAVAAPLSGHIGPNKEKKKYNLLEKKAEKAERDLGKRLKQREKTGKLAVTGVSKEKD